MLRAVWSHFQGGSLCLTSSVCWFFRLTSSVTLWGRGDAANKQHCHVHTVSQPRWTCPFSRRTNHSGSTVLSWEPSEAGPRLRAPPWSKSLRFGAQVALKRHRFGWDCVLCPSQVRVAQEFSERGRCNSLPFLSLLLSFLGGLLVPLVRQMVTVQHPQKS